MKARIVERVANSIAEHKLLIIRQQQIAAELARKGQSECARRERSKLFHLLHKLDLMQFQRPPIG